MLMLAATGKLVIPASISSPGLIALEILTGETLDLIMAMVDVKFFGQSSQLLSFVILSAR